ncbi:MAG: carbonic anhydrase, partial [Psychromonas sp.]
MKKSLLLSCLLVTSGAVFASQDAHWGYAGEHGPDHWAQLTPENHACS